MNQLKLRSEIRKVIKSFPDYKKEQLFQWVGNVFHDGDSESFEKIDQEFMYPYRWDLFESITDSPILYDEDSVNDFIDTCIGIMLNSR